MKKSEERLILKFMGTAIEKVNSCMARIWALEKLMVEKGIAVPKDMKERVKEAEHHPTHLKNTRMLEDMIQQFNSDI